MAIRIRKKQGELFEDNLRIEKLEREPDHESRIESLTVNSVSAQPSPLEAYIVAHGMNADTMRNLSRPLLGSALTASQESRALTDLQERFARQEGMTYLAKATLSELIFTHRERLLRALDEEQKLLNQTRISTGVNRSSGTEQTGHLLLVSAAERNLSLCEELALGSTAQSRSAEAIVPELIASLNALRIRAQQARIDSQLTTAQSGKK